MKRSLYTIEGAAVYCMYTLLLILPVDTASYICGLIMRKIGPLFKANKIAKKNIAMCFPNLTQESISQIISDMWDNLGRNIGELPYSSRLSKSSFKKRIKCQKGFDTLPSNSILLSGHYGNFELIPSIADCVGYKLHLVYRPINNPIVDHLMLKMRAKRAVNMIPKGVAGVKQIVDGINANEALGMLIDQKMNQGEDLKFFGLNAKTTTLPAKLAIKYNLPVYMIRLERTTGAYFNLRFERVHYTSDDTANTLMQHINDVLEKWIRNKPSQWFWVHKRWG
ncbi:MAG: lysophospholipid acyltransferase family protein [Alphaproteobacteria bacterium]|jgi:KDO2-lipid IV(A) lauroyltransferase|nr:lysophospholipid acyltransferase family protein [Candidatus Jidaibacter sp.]